MTFDSHGQPVFGPLNTDRPHQIKIKANLYYQFPDAGWGWSAVRRGEPYSDQPPDQYGQQHAGLLPRPDH